MECCHSLEGPKNTDEGMGLKKQKTKKNHKREECTPSLFFQRASTIKPPDN